MSAVVPNIAKGKWAYYGGQPAANDALLWILFSGTETDDNVRDADSVAALQATSLNEATFTSYARQTATGVSVVVDDTNNRVDLDANDPSFTSGSIEAQKRIVLAYDPDTTGGTDSDIIPIGVDDFDASSPASGGLTYQVASGGMLRAS